MSFCNNFSLLCLCESFQDKSADVRKAAEGCISEIVRVSGQETVGIFRLACSIHSLNYDLFCAFFLSLKRISKISKAQH